MRKCVTGILAIIFLIAVASIGNCGGEKNAQDYFNEGAKCFEAGNYDGAIEMYKKGLELEPNSAGGYNLLGMGYRFKYNTTGDMDYKNKEIEAFQKAIDMDPKFWGAMINLGATYYYMGEKKKAAPYFKKALEIYPNNPEKTELEKMIQEGEI